VDYVEGVGNSHTDKLAKFGTSTNRYERDQAVEFLLKGVSSARIGHSKKQQLGDLLPKTMASGISTCWPFN